MLKMESDEDCKDLLFLLALYRKYKKRKGKRRRYWVRPIFSKREDRGSFGSLVQEMRVTDPQSHFRYFHMSKDLTSFCTRYADSYKRDAKDDTTHFAFIAGWSITVTSLQQQLYKTTNNTC